MNILPLSQWILERSAVSAEQHRLYEMIHDVSLVGKDIAAMLRRAGVLELLGSTGYTNGSGDSVQRLDAQANTLFKQHVIASKHFAALASEEEEEIVQIPECNTSAYIVAFDPIDGSKNLDTNGSVGTVITIFQRTSTMGTQVEESDFCGGGKTVVAAGYILYGPSTVFVFSVGDGVHCAALDPENGEWMLLTESLQIPDTVATFTYSDAYVPYWDAGSQSYISDLKKRYPEAAARNAGALVADMHRILLQGGVFVRPYDHTTERRAKLRLVYEVRAFAYILQHAGGDSTAGDHAVLDAAAQHIHDTSPFIGGTKKEVQQYLQHFHS